MSTTNIESTTWFDCLPTEIIFIIFNYLSSSDIIYAFFLLSQRYNKLLLKNKRYLTNVTWLDLLPIEIIFIIFKYLSNNNIIYAFFLLNQKFNDLLLQNPCYLNNLELSLIDLNTWKNILSIIDSHVESLKINHLSLPLTYFPNLKSIIISSPYGLPDEQLKSIVERNRFQNLHSLTLKLTNFEDIFYFIKCTPNLKYLNVQSIECYRHQIPLNNGVVKLEQLYITLKKPFDTKIHFGQLIHDIKQFSSSLICLSLNLVDLSIKTTNDFPFNSIKLQQFLESMIELKQFHLYAKLLKTPINNDIVLSKFQNEFWFNHNWSFGMYDKYFFTVPFGFDYLYEFYKGFDNVKSNNPSILINNPQIWCNVKSIELFLPYNYDKNFVKELKIKIPRLTSIQFYDIKFPSPPKPTYLHIINDEREKIDLILDNVTTIEFLHGDIENIKNWIIYSLPNLRHFILFSTRLPSINSELAPVLNERIQQLDIYENAQFNKELIEISYIYFSNVQYININLYNSSKGFQFYVDVMKILTNFKNLKTLLIHRLTYMDVSVEIELRELIKYLDMNGIIKNYEVRYFQECCSFSKMGY